MITFPIKLLKQFNYLKQFFHLESQMVVVAISIEINIKFIL